MKINVVILAGGIGTRMGNTDLPKQFMMLGSKPIIIHTIEQFMFVQKIKQIIVCCPKNWVSHMNDILKKYLPDLENIVVIEGGKTRNETIINGCNYIKENFGISKDDIIVTHDSVRPFITKRIIDDNIKVGKTCDAVDTVIPSTDTIVESEDGKLIANIPNRKNMYQGQTPQTFKIEKLMKIYESHSDDEKDILTDACKMFIMKKNNVKMVMGEDFNIKITTMHDLKVANAILMEKK